ncbi:Hpt domain-containing protein [Sphingomonas radiodurans]|uniref:Hpt domain-containing protein n=1 Tax=Sphingomonas radiodurans TaxID=2890321 RepID=UPI001E5B2560|nr:Hpt domain-containing protein [Sphingomonas radiodurans]WBH17560.1 Hpt domain-containing protein [Sphingomonas radiodurans]
MAYDPGAIDATLAAAVGDDPALIAELRAAFLESAQRGLAAIEQANDDEAWRSAAWRLKGLAASFGAVRLMTIATRATEASAGDVVLLKRLRRAVAQL